MPDTICRPELAECTIDWPDDIGLPPVTVWRLTCPHWTAHGEHEALIDLAAEHTDWTRRRQELAPELLAAALADGALDADLEREGQP